jgi:hypothetical protein
MLLLWWWYLEEEELGGWCWSKDGNWKYTNEMSLSIYAITPTIVAGSTIARTDDSRISLWLWMKRLAAAFPTLYQRRKLPIERLPGTACAPISVQFAAETFTFFDCFFESHNKDKEDISDRSYIRVMLTEIRTSQFQSQWYISIE